MSMVTSAKSASYYLQMWKDTEDQIENERNLVAVGEAKNGNESLKFLEDRVGKLIALAEYYKGKYQEAYRLENGGKKTYRLRTFNNGL